MPAKQIDRQHKAKLYSRSDVARLLRMSPQLFHRHERTEHLPQPKATIGNRQYFTSAQVSEIMEHYDEPWQPGEQ